MAYTAIPPGGTRRQFVRWLALAGSLLGGQAILAACGGTSTGSLSSTAASTSRGTLTTATATNASSTSASARAGSVSVATSSTAATSGTNAATAGAPASTAKVAAAQTELTFTGDPKSTGDQARANLWNKEHPDQPVSIVSFTLGLGVDAQSKFVAALASGTAPSVVSFDRFQVTGFALRNAFLPLDPLIGTAKYDLGRFLPATVQEAKGMDGKLYGIPTGTDDRLLYFNKELYRQAGLDPSQPPQDWATLQDHAVRLTKGQSGQVSQLGMDLAFSPPAFYLWAWAGGGDFLKKDATGATDFWHCDLNNPLNVDALNFNVQLLKAQGGQRTLDYAKKNAGGSGISNASWGQLPKGQDEFIASKLAMYVQGNWQLSTIAQTMKSTSLDFGVASIPRKSASMPAVTQSGGFAYVIPHGTKNSSEAFTLATTLLSEPYWLAFAGAVSAPGSLQTFLPGNTAQPALDQLLHAKYPFNIPSVDQAWDYGQKLMSGSRFRPQTVAGAEMIDALHSAWDQALALQKTPQDALDEAQRVTQGILDQRAKDYPH